MKWVAWIQHHGSRQWHDVRASEDFEVVYNALLKYVRENNLIVRFYILMSNTTPDALPSDAPGPMELRG